MDEMYSNMFAAVNSRVRDAIERSPRLDLVGAGPKVVINAEGVFVSVGVSIKGEPRPAEFLGTGSTPEEAADNLVNSFGEWIRLSATHKVMK